MTHPLESFVLCCPLHSSLTIRNGEDRNDCFIISCCLVEDAAINYFMPMEACRALFPPTINEPHFAACSVVHLDDTFSCPPKFLRIIAPTLHNPPHIESRFYTFSTVVSIVIFLWTSFICSTFSYKRSKCTLYSPYLLSILKSCLNE